MYDNHHDGRMAAGLPCREPGLYAPVTHRDKARAGGMILAAAVFLLASVLVLFFQVQGFLDRIEVKTAASDAGGDTRIKAISRHMESLQDKFSMLLADSVEMRLKTLEQTLEAGKVGAEDLRIFEDLKKDLGLLQNYVERPGARPLDYASVEHSRFRPQAQAALPEIARTPDADALSREASELKVLFYFCFALSATTLLTATAYWFRQRRRMLQFDQRHLRTAALPPKTPEPGN